MVKWWLNHVWLNHLYDSSRCVTQFQCLPSRYQMLHLKYITQPMAAARSEEFSINWCFSLAYSVSDSYEPGHSRSRKVNIDTSYTVSELLLLSFWCYSPSDRSTQIISELRCQVPLHRFNFLSTNEYCCSHGDTIHTAICSSNFRPEQLDWIDSFNPVSCRNPRCLEVYRSSRSRRTSRSELSRAQGR